MITFNQLAEYLTNRQRYDWFLFWQEHLAELTPEELDEVHVELMPECSYVRIWYPKSKFFDRIINEEELKNMLMKAAMENDTETILKLKEKLNALPKRR